MLAERRELPRDKMSHLACLDGVPYPLWPTFGNGWETLSEREVTADKRTYNASIYSYAR